MSATDVTERVPSTEHAGASITGRCRDVNEDGWAALPRLGVYFVVDGCGGDAPGRLAADLAVQSVERLCSADSTVPVELLALAIQEANAQFYAAAKAKSLGMGATIAALRFAPPWVATASVGDCRIYRYRGGSGPEHGRADRVLARLTTDDLLWVDMVHAAASIAQVTGAYTTHRNVVTRALGVSASVDIKVRYTKHQAGDVYLLCSDGVSTQLDDDEIRECIADDDLPLAARCARLLAAADARVGADNATAVLIQS